MRGDREIRPFLVLGSGRSGTTALFNELAAGMDVSTFPALGGRYPSLLRPSLLLNRIGVRQHMLRPSSESVALLASAGLSQQRMLQLGRPMEVGDLSEPEIGRLRSIFEAAARFGPSASVLAKNTGNTARVLPLAAALPEGRFIYIVRDPRSVVSSLLRVGFWADMPLWWADATPAELEANGRSAVSIAAEHWTQQVNAAERGFAELSEHRVHRLAYESLVTDAEIELGRLAEFMAPTSPSARGLQPSSLNASSLGTWQSNLTPLQVAVIEDVAGAEMERYGYT